MEVNGKVMASKNKFPSKGANTEIRFSIPAVPEKGVVIPAAGMLQAVRERLGLSQAALGKECGVSRNVIANYEAERTKVDTQSSLSLEDYLKLWRILEAKEEAFNAPPEEGKPSAADAVLGLLWWTKFNAVRSLAEIDGQIVGLQKKQEGIRRQMEKLDAEIQERSL
jgi:transcriptional regulator with XRE-family HTH domain